MKKLINILGIFIIISILLCIYNNVYAVEVPLEQIVEKFNKSSIIDAYKDVGGSINATNDTNSIDVEVLVNGQMKNVVLLLNENILSIEIDTQEEELAFLKAYISLYVIDIIGQIQGYEEGELMDTINSKQSDNYTLEQEGYEIKKITETKLKIKTDITKNEVHPKC